MGLATLRFQFYFKYHNAVPPLGAEGIINAYQIMVLHCMENHYDLLMAELVEEQIAASEALFNSINVIMYSITLPKIVATFFLDLGTCISRYILASIIFISNIIQIISSVFVDTVILIYSV